MPEEPKAEIKTAEDVVRDVKNWVFTFAKEYDLSDDKVKDLHREIDNVSVAIGGIECKPGEEKPEVKTPEDALRDFKNWVATHLGLEGEAAELLNTKIEELAKKIGEITCK